MKWLLAGASTIAAEYMIPAMRARPAGPVAHAVSGSGRPAVNSVKSSAIALAAREAACSGARQRIDYGGL